MAEWQCHGKIVGGGRQTDGCGERLASGGEPEIQQSWQARLVVAIGEQRVHTGEVAKEESARDVNGVSFALGTVCPAVSASGAGPGPSPQRL